LGLVVFLGLCFRLSVPARGGGVSRASGRRCVGDWGVCGVFARARPGGSVSRARRAARPRKPRRGGWRSTGCVLTHLCCMNCSVTDLAIKIFVILVRLKKSRRPRLRARACNRVFQKRSEARARAGLALTLLCGELASPTISTEADRVWFFCCRANRFFPGTASTRNTGGVLESDRTAASSFPLVTGCAPHTSAAAFNSRLVTRRPAVGAKQHIHHPS